MATRRAAPGVCGVDDHRHRGDSEGAETAAWAAAIDVIRKPAPRYAGRFLHRDFHPGNVLFDMPPTSAAGARITGVVDWAAASWGSADLDVAHCSTNLALRHRPAWGLRWLRRLRRRAGCWPRPRASGCTGGCGTG
ncbi:phosphotransferase [Streptomyces sp. MMG1121]|uniref:phosphotransferase n=1 Tax=Streptomyces sp. MMG1121 TaxID=1415544 RepID=UPI000B0BCA84|nr:phosphotransferase [Streptomyces sp. MMG1121]